MAVGGRRFRLPTRAGPGPALRGAHQSGRNRVVFYIVYGPLDLTRTTEVTIETLVLPKRLPGSSQDSVCVSGGRSFQPSHRHRDGGQRANQQMHVVRHYYPGAKTIETPFAVSAQNGIGDQIGNPRVPEPKGARCTTIQDPIAGHQSVSGSWVGVGISIGRQCSPPPPGQEQPCIAGMEMR